VLGRPPGTEFLDAETGPGNSPPNGKTARRDSNPGIEWPEIPTENGLFEVVSEIRVLGRLDGGVRSRMRTGLHEVSGNFSKKSGQNRLFGSDLLLGIANSAVIQARYTTIKALSC
jgi:hypothetical protein